KGPLAEPRHKVPPRQQTAVGLGVAARHALSAVLIKQCPQKCRPRAHYRAPPPRYWATSIPQTRPQIAAHNLAEAQEHPPSLHRLYSISKVMARWPRLTAPNYHCANIQAEQAAGRPRWAGRSWAIYNRGHLQRKQETKEY